MVKSRFEDVYLSVGTSLGLLSGAFTFVAAWWWCTAEYGFLLGFGLGWLPASILACMVVFAVRFLWGLLIIPMVALIFDLVAAYPRETCYVVVFALICAGIYVACRRWPAQAKLALKAWQRVMIAFYALLLIFIIGLVTSGG